ncbi:MAG: MFS transporter [Anaerolineales bacterium]|nr:MFS transporter [Anaerolineales bacterium]
MTLEKTIEARPSEDSHAIRRLLRLRDFRLFWLGEFISSLGDQFYLIALPWLVLQLTHSAIAVGTVMAVAGVPRAIFMLLGGAITDRFYPRKVMMSANIVRMLVVVGMAALVLTATIKVWMLYLFALLFGLADAFYYPAQQTMVPLLVDPDDLPTGNAVMQGTTRFSVFLGPVVAGAMISLLNGGNINLLDASGERVLGLRGIGVSLSVDAVTFLVSVVSLSLMHAVKPHHKTKIEKDKHLLRSIGEILQYVWKDTVLRMVFLVALAINFLGYGPAIVGIPILAHTRLSGSAAAYGTIISAYGGGNLIGIILAGLLPKLKRGQLGPVLIGVVVAFGLGMGSLAWLASTGVIAVIIFVLGLGAGYIVIILLTWLQRKIPDEMMGRMMSLVMLSMVGLIPISQAIAGVVLEISLSALFIGTGVLLLGLVVWIGFQSEIWQLGLDD